MPQQPASINTALITGSAKRIGAAIAHHLAAQGWNLVLHYRTSKNEAEALATELRTAHRITVTLIKADLANPESLTDFWKNLPPVTTLIHNAAHFARDTIRDFTPAALRTHLATNLEAPLILTQGFLAQLPKSETGRIIILGDGTKGWSISPEFFTYSISKLAWESLIDLLATSVAPRAHANLITLAPTLPGALDDADMFQRLAEHAPLKRVSNPEDVCTAIDFIISNHGVTGQVISLASGIGLTTKRPFSIL